MIKVNSSQFNYKYGDQIHFPYSIASLVGYIQSKEELSKEFSFEKSFVFRDNLEENIKECKNSDILLSYNSVIILHNEYVTKKMFDAITSHPNVVFLYPNSLYAEISVNYEDNTISLIKGHGYPESSIINGFDWEFENTHPYEFDTKCNNWDFYTITNGVMLNCYPEQKIWNDELLLKKLKEITS